MKRIVISRGQVTPRTHKSKKTNNTTSESIINGNNYENEVLLSSKLPDPIPFVKRLKEIDESEETINDTIVPISKFPTVPPKYFQNTKKFDYKRESSLEFIENENFLNKKSDNLNDGFEQTQDINPHFVIRDEFISGDDQINKSKKRQEWIRVLILQAMKRPSTYEALTYLEETLDRWFKKREIGTIDLLVLPANWWHEIIEDWDILDPISSVPWLQKLSSIVSKYQLYCVPGTFFETQQDLEQEDVKLRFETTILLNRKGLFVGLYRKRKNSLPSMSSGDRCSIFDTDFGRISLMICSDLENVNILKENLAYKPDIIVNPTFILSNTGIGEDHSRFWRTAMTVIGGQVERICLEHFVSIVRCDQPFSSKFGVCASGSSQLIGPYRSILGNTFGESCFVTQIPRKQKEDTEHWISSTRIPIKERTEPRMNSQNRYRYIPFKRHVSNESKDSKVISVKKIGNTVISASINGSLMFHNYSTRQPLKTINNAHNGSILAMDVVGKSIWTSSSDRTVREWNLNGECIHMEQLPPLGSFITCIAAHPRDANIMWLGDSSGSVRFYDRRAGSILGCRTVSTSRDNSTEVLTLKSFNDSVCCVNANTSVVKIWDSHAGFSKVPISFSCSNVITSLSNPYNDSILIGTNDRIESWSLQKGDQILKYNIPENTKISTLQILSDTHGIVSFIPTDSSTLGQLNLFNFQNYKSGGISNVFLHDFSESSQLFTATSISIENQNIMLIGDLYGKVSTLEFEANMIPANISNMFK